jgi:hypothetical protein
MMKYNLAALTERHLCHYSEQIGMVVGTPQVQNMIDRMMVNDLILRQSHGVYAVADPFVR